MAGPLSLTKDTTATVNVVLMCSILAGVAGGAFYLSALINKIDSMDGTLSDIKVAIQANTINRTVDAQTIAVLRAQLSDTQDRVRELEKRIHTPK